MTDFFTPPNHVKFLSKNLCGKIEGEILEASIAYLEPYGGGPLENHTHNHDHLFFVVQGEARIQLEKEERVLKKDEAFLVKGSIPHSVWNNVEYKTVMIGLNIAPRNESF